MRAAKHVTCSRGSGSWLDVAASENSSDTEAEESEECAAVHALALRAGHDV
jgi:hypothetical protein